MDNQKTALFGAVIAVAAGLFGLNTMVDGFSQNDAAPMQNDGASFLGHVTYTLYDKDGNIKSYEQTDNVVTRIGMDCAISFLFNNATVDGSGTATEQCNPSDSYTGFNYIAIGNATTPTAAAISTALEGDMTGLNGISRQQDSSIDFTLATGVGNSASVVINTNTPFTFTQLNDGATATTVTESGLFDAATGGNMFAEQVFSTAVSNTDSLAVEWTITVQ